MTSPTGPRGTCWLVLFVTANAAWAGCFGSRDTGEERTLVGHLHAAYADQPFSAPTPGHEWSFIDSSRTRLAFLHWIEEDAESATQLFAVGDGFKGKACAGEDGVTEAEIAAGYVHFHAESSADWTSGHDGAHPDQMGYWLRHVAVQDGFDAGNGPSVKGRVYLFLPTTEGLPAC